MKFSEIVLMLNTDEFWITVDNDIETTVHITGTAQEIYHALAKFIKYTVVRITPVNFGLEIDLSSK